MTLEALRASLIKLMKQVHRDASDPDHPYTKGYIDALRYVVEWIDEQL